jgi:hypothetical protein
MRGPSWPDGYWAYLRWLSAACRKFAASASTRLANLCADPLVDYDCRVLPSELLILPRNPLSLFWSAPASTTFSIAPVSGLGKSAFCRFDVWVRSADGGLRRIKNHLKGRNQSAHSKLSHSGC